MSAFWPAMASRPAVPPVRWHMRCSLRGRRAGQLAANAACHSLFERHTGAFGQAAHFLQQVGAVPLEHRLELRHATLELLVRKFRPGADHLDVRPDLAGSLLAVLAAQFPVSAARLVERVFRRLARGDRSGTRERRGSGQPQHVPARNVSIFHDTLPMEAACIIISQTHFHRALRPLPTPLRLRIGISARPA